MFTTVESSLVVADEQAGQSAAALQGGIQGIAFLVSLRGAMEVEFNTVQSVLDNDVTKTPIPSLRKAAKVHGTESGNRPRFADLAPNLKGRVGLASHRVCGRVGETHCGGSSGSRGTQ